MNESILQSVEVTLGEKPDWIVVWLHGLGADGHDFEPLVPLLGLDDANVHFVFPHAVERPVTVNGGMTMRAWYDILALELDRDQDRAGIERSAQEISALIEHQHQAHGVPYEKIILAGFSQGGAMAVHVALNLDQPVAGLLALSTYLLFADEQARRKSEFNTQIPVFVGHGSMDPVVPMAQGKALAHSLRDWGFTVTWNQYPAPHSVHPMEVQHISAWLKKIIQ